MYNKTMGCLEGLAHGFKNHVQGQHFLRIIQFIIFFIILLGRNITTSPPYCVFFLIHIFFLRIINFFTFFIVLLGRNITTSSIFFTDN